MLYKEVKIRYTVTEYKWLGKVFLLLKDKTVVLGVTGGIAAYKMANVASMLRKLHCNVHVIMTKNATQFITPLTFETLTNNRCSVDTFDRDFKYDVHHISLAKQADLILVAPATANVIAKMAHGIADDMLTTVVLAAPCKKLVAPAMNTNMLENPITQDNLKTLEKYGFEVIPSDTGMLACKDVGSGKLPKEEVLVDYILKHLARPKDMEGKRVLVTAGATQEALDPVRYITNHSTGKMGFAIARECMLRGAQVTLVAGENHLPPVPFVETVNIRSAQDMFREVSSRLDKTDLLIKAAEKEGWRDVHSPGTDYRHSGVGGSTSAPGTVPLRIQHGNPEYAGKQPGQAGKEESGHDRGQ